MSRKLDKKCFILGAIKGTVQLAYGCTEIGIVSLACAQAGVMLKSKLKKADVFVSTCVYRNDSMVGVPLLGICGIPTIAAVGFVLKNPEKKLSCTSDLTKRTILEVKKLGASGKIKIKVNYSAPPIYTKVVAVDCKNNKIEVIIENSHSNIASAKFNGKETIKNVIKKDFRHGPVNKSINYDLLVDNVPIEKAYSVCKTFSEKDLSFLINTCKVNKKIEY